MKRFIFISALLMIAFTLNAQPEDSYVVDGKYVLVERYYEDGSVRETGSYLKDVPDGRWVSYYPDGTIHTEAYYVNGQKTGKWLVYTKDGNYLYEVVYENNLLKSSNRWKIEERNLMAGE